jgi:hypothetical protein
MAEEEYSALTLQLSRKVDENEYPTGSESIVIRLPIKDSETQEAILSGEGLLDFHEVDIEYTRRHPARTITQRILLTEDAPLRFFERDPNTGEYQDTFDINLQKLVDRKNHDTSAKPEPNILSRILGKFAFGASDAPEIRKIDAVQLAQLLESFKLAKFRPPAE